MLTVGWKVGQVKAPPRQSRPWKGVLKVFNGGLARYYDRQIMRLSKSTKNMKYLQESIKLVWLVKAAQIKAAFELGRRQDMEADPGQVSITSPEGLARALRKGIMEKTKEHFKLVLLNTRNKVIAISTISVGTLNASLVHPREVFRDALTHSASSIILAHNHPSDDPEPSDDDVSLTRRLADAGRLMGIEVLDHIIITRKGYTSFKERGLL